MSDEIDFEFINEVGNNVKKVYDDEQNTDWFNDIIDAYNESDEFPEGTLQDIIDYLLSFGDEKRTNLANQVIDIQNQDGDDNILSAIFFGSDDVGTISNTGTSVVIYEEDDEEEFDESIPEQFFNRKIDTVKNSLNISFDLAYLLLKKFNFNTQKAQLEWLSDNQESILKSLNIKIGTSNIPTTLSPITFNNLGIGECPICYGDTDEIYELYCGHKYCKKCLFVQIKNQVEELKTPVCPECKSEILSDNVYEILNDFPKLAKRYESAVTKSEINIDKEIRPCLCCDRIITPSHKISLLFGRCPNCKFATCLSCKQGFHGPLTCINMNDFFGNRRDSMQQLEEDQESWYFRERRLQEYRRENKKPVFEYFDKRIEAVLLKNKKEEQEEKDKLAEYQFFINKKSKELNTLEKQERSLFNKADTAKLDEVKAQIEKVKYEIDTKKYVQQALKETIEKNKADRQQDVLDADTEKEYLINAISNETKFDYFLDEYKRLLNSKAYQKLNVTLTDEETIKRLTKLCPNCGAPIEKSQGCNWMKCICGFEFCYFCNQPWKPTHSDHHKCPKYDLMSEKRKGKSQCGINFEDMNDKEFYPPPMTDDKRTDYIRYSNLSMQYMNSKEKLEKIEDDLRKTTNDEPDKSIADLPYNELTPKNRLIKCLMRDNSEAVANELAEKIINTIIFAQKIVMYGYPQMYYIMNKNEISKSTIFEYRLCKLEEKVDNLIDLINNPEKSNFKDFESAADAIDSEASIILEDGEKY